MMSLRRAPTALRTPISRVRSVTDTSMMFITPMPPTISEMHARSSRSAASGLPWSRLDGLADAVV